MNVNITEKIRHKRKFLNFILSNVKTFKNLRILEFGVSEDAMPPGFF